MKHLILIDHDGTLCLTNSNAYDSLRYAAEDAAHFFFPGITLPVLNWDNIFSSTRGLTERYLARYIAHCYHVPEEKCDIYINMFMDSRVSWYTRKKETGEYVMDAYYPDALQLIEELTGTDNQNFYIMLVTGNPEKVLRTRMSKQLLQTFRGEDGALVGAFGHQADTREELVKNAINLATERIPEFKPVTDEKGFLKNVTYIGDGINDMLCGLHSQVKTVWIPSRSIQSVLDTKSDIQTEFLCGYFNQQLLVTNDLGSKEVGDFIGIRRKSYQG